ncbi:MAG: TIGR04283 family arsenosugar biosynthesis glycosyltransferase [Burkholderiales bacterium]|nr:TIGR04283 family arsenosugar biosynthesis glycosyltransferase [Burkholderiales bacterium]
MPQLSIIIPTLNEAAGIAATLRSLQTLRACGHEVIVVDGGSADATIGESRPWSDHIVHTRSGRARQMNAGAAIARHSMLLFLHADTRLPDSADQLILGHYSDAMDERWGRFDVRLSGSAKTLRMVAFMMNWRSRLSGIATGDQAIFASRALFDAAGGYPEIALMEDLALSKRLKRLAWPCCLRERVESSSRRWEKNGAIRTILMMWRLRLAYFCGASPRLLAKIYAGQQRH